MTVGCPVAVSGIYAMPEQLGDAALYFDPDSPRDIADAILKVVGDEGIRSALISRGFVRASQRSQDAFDARFREIILGVLDEP
jgi:glycosyltransferase involved in cell wall biosynthesis